MLLSDTIHSAARRRPAHPALIFEGETYTYRQMSARVARTTASLRQLVEAGDRVALLADNCPTYIDCLYAVPAAGAIATLVNQRLTGPEVEGILADAEPRLVVVGAAYLDRVLSVLDRLPSIERILVIGEVAEAAALDGARVPVGSAGELLAGEAVDPDDLPRPDDGDVAWLIYTSGTTGTPKGAMLTHRSIAAAMLNALLEWRPTQREVMLFCFPLCHVAAFVVLAYLLQGTTLVLMPGFDPGRYLALVEEHRVTHAAGAPTMINFLLQHPDIDTADLTSIELMIYGASPMPPALLERAIERFGPVFFQTYGMTELSGNVIVLDHDEHRLAMAGRPEILAAAGRPESLAEVRIVDEAMADVAPGEVGELVVRGDQVMAGYWRNGEATAEVMAGGWLHTGDLARADDEGRIYIVDRKKDMVISGGENVYPREVEDVLAAHPGISEAAVIGRPDEAWGEVVTAVLVARPGHELDPDEVVAFCRRSLAGYKVPRRVEIVDEIPKNAAGKHLKRLLRTAQP